jgi:transcriptional regulator with XRE-family HTH domain
MTGFRDRLRDLRKSRELTQKQLATNLGTHVRVVQQYELGKRKPNYDAIINVARYFNVSADWLLGIGSDPTIHSPIAPTELPPTQ